MGIEGCCQIRGKFWYLLTLAESKGAVMYWDVISKVGVCPCGLVEVYLGLLAWLGKDISRCIREDTIAGRIS